LSDELVRSSQYLDWLQCVWIISSTLDHAPKVGLAKPAPAGESGSSKRDWLRL
jgi:hypothetical protein